MLTPELVPTEGHRPEFLCFHRRSEGDVVVGKDKLMGSAQRRSKAAILQHGSLLLAKSDFAPSLLGLAELLPVIGETLANRRLFDEEVRERIERGIDALLGVRVQCGVSLAKDLCALAEARMARFESPEWRCRV